MVGYHILYWDENASSWGCLAPPPISSSSLHGAFHANGCRWAVEATFIASATPVPQAKVFLAAGASAHLGYCGLDNDVRGFNPCEQRQAHGRHEY